MRNGPPRCAVWYATGARPGLGESPDIPILEAAGFDLFFLGHPEYDQWTFQQRLDFVTDSASLLERPDSQVVVPLGPFLTLGWFDGDGLELFLRACQNEPRVGGYLIWDDFFTAPLPTVGVPVADALWVLRWYYRMSRNISDDQENSVNADLIPQQAMYATAHVPATKVGISWQAQVIRRADYTGQNLPPDIFWKGGSWDVMCPYYYAYRSSIPANERSKALQASMSRAAMDFRGPLMPIIQAAYDQIGSSFDPLVYPDQMEQYDCLLAAGVLRRTRTVLFYSAHTPPAGAADLTSGFLGENLLLRDARAVIARHKSIDW